MATDIVYETAQQFLKTGGKKGILYYIDENGNSSLAGNQQEVYFSSWSDTVFYSMPIADAPWTSICPLSSVVDFLETES